MVIISKTSGRTYTIAEAFEPKGEKTYDILVLFDWNKEDEAPVLIDYLFGASFLAENLDAIQEIIAKYERANGFIE